MIWIILGHALGFLIAFGSAGHITVENTWLNVFGVGGLILFLEIQLFWSLKFGRIFFRGMVDASDFSRFAQCQFGYGFLAGFLLYVSGNNLF